MISYTNVYGEDDRGGREGGEPVVDHSAPITTTIIIIITIMFQLSCTGIIIIIIMYKPL